MVYLPQVQEKRETIMFSNNPKQDSTLRYAIRIFDRYTKNTTMRYDAEKFNACDRAWNLKNRHTVVTVFDQQTDEIVKHINW